VEKASKWGLTPNAFIDAMTVAVGARSVYEQRYKRYKKDGYTDEQAEALIEAEVDKINDDLPRFKRIAHVVVREREFDKTTTNKIRRFVEDNKRA
jgi:hypothetical protein